jgi:hypothetical protein
MAGTVKKPRLRAAIRRSTHRPGVGGMVDISTIQAARVAVIPSPF